MAAKKTTPAEAKASNAVSPTAPRETIDELGHELKRLREVEAAAKKAIERIKKKVFALVPSNEQRDGLTVRLRVVTTYPETVDLDEVRIFYAKSKKKVPMKEGQRNEIKVEPVPAIEF